MLSLRFLMGLTIGGAAVYFLDPEHGPERRSRFRSWSEQKRGAITDITNSTVTTSEAEETEPSVKKAR